MGEACFTFKFRTQEKHWQYQGECDDMARVRAGLGVHWRIATAKGNHNPSVGSHFRGFRSEFGAGNDKVQLGRAGEFDPPTLRAQEGDRQIVQFSFSRNFALF